MIYGEIGFLAVVSLLALPPPPPPPHSPISKLDRRHTGRLRKRDNLLSEEGGGEARSYDGEKAWYSINYSILSSESYRG